MKKHFKSLKRYAALWLSIAMLVGSVYINSDENSLATENVGGVAEDSLDDAIQQPQHDENTEADGSDTVKTVRATASDLLDEVEDGEVIDDTSTDSNAVIDGEGEDATESDAILDVDIATLPNALLSTATSSNVVNPNAASFLRLDSSITGSIATPSDFAIGKAGTKTMKIAYLFDFQDIAEGDRSSIGAEIVIPKGFDVDESTIETDSNWTTTVTTNDDGDNLIIFKNIGNLTTLRQTLVIVQDAQYLINHLSERHIYNFQSKFYNNYGNENQALVVRNEGDEATDSFTFEADNTTPTWTVDPVCNNETWKPKDIFGTNYKVDKINEFNNSAGEDFITGKLNKDNNGACASFCYDNKYLIVKFKKTLGYIADDTIFRFMTEVLPIYTYNGKQYYGIIVNYTDVNGNTIHICNDSISNNIEKYNAFQVFDGEYSLQAADIANQYTGDNIKQFATYNGSTISDILYNEGTFEIKV
ncbi:MAG: hypothetical protein Q3982_09995, partial [Phoenicibacter congonensis]|nr:hypothetical protein [Phoenicibacter congonensis]